MKTRKINLFCVLPNFLFFSPISFAQSGENPVGGGLQWLIDQIYGPIGIGLATLGIMAVGMLCLGHVLEWKRLVQTVIGVTIIFSAGAIVQLIHTAVSR